MIPHIQTDTGDGTGSCFATCIAAILDLPLESVPNFRALAGEGKCMVQMAEKWLREAHGKRFIGIELFDDNGSLEYKTDLCIFNRCFDPNDLVILSGVSPRKNADGSTKCHAVVGRPRLWGFEVVHDPHPSGEGIVGQPYGVKWIVNAQT